MVQLSSVSKRIFDPCALISVSVHWKYWESSSRRANGYWLKPILYTPFLKTEYFPLQCKEPVLHSQPLVCWNTWQYVMCVTSWRHGVYVASKKHWDTSVLSNSRPSSCPCPTRVRHECHIQPMVCLHTSLHLLLFHCDCIQGLDKMLEALKIRYTFLY
jgi:hypothetical protein